MKTRKNNNEITNDVKLRKLLMDFLKDADEEDILSNLHLFIPRLTFDRILAIDFLYKKIINHSGVILEFGCRYGGNLVLYNNLCGTYEPYNYTRKIYGFDTFQGFPTVNDIDDAGIGDYSVMKNYELQLDEILNIHQNYSPISHITKNNLLKGDVRVTLPEFLKHNSRVFALVYFDMDLYAPTLEVLKLIKPFLAKGTIIVFDDFNNENFWEKVEQY